MHPFRTVSHPTPEHSPQARQNGRFVADSTLDLEEPQEFAQLLADYHADYRPTAGIETELVRQLAVATQRLRRFERLESAVLDTAAIAHTRHEASVLMQESFERNWTMVDRIMKARAAAERSFNRVYAILEARKRARITPRPAPKTLEIETNVRHQTQPQTRATSVRLSPDSRLLSTELGRQP